MYVKHLVQGVAPNKTSKCISFLLPACLLTNTKILHSFLSCLISKLYTSSSTSYQHSIPNTSPSETFQLINNGKMFDLFRYQIVNNNIPKSNHQKFTKRISDFIQKAPCNKCRVESKSIH